MTLEKFEDIMMRMKAQDKVICDLYKKKVDIIEFVDPYASIIADLIKEIYGEVGYDWWSWFCYENDFGERIKEEGPKAWDADKTPICYDIKSLWEYMENLKK